MRDKKQVDNFLNFEKLKHVILAAKKVGGILANARDPVGFLSGNLAIQNNVMGTALHHKVDRLLLLGSSCIYPKLVPRPIMEDSLLAGQLEYTNEAYVSAKIANLVAGIGGEHAIVRSVMLHHLPRSFDILGHVTPVTNSTKISGLASNDHCNTRMDSLHFHESSRGPHAVSFSRRYTRDIGSIR